MSKIAATLEHKRREYALAERLGLALPYDTMEWRALTRDVTSYRDTTRRLMIYGNSMILTLNDQRFTYTQYGNSGYRSDEPNTQTDPLNEAFDLEFTPDRRLWIRPHVAPLNVAVIAARLGWAVAQRPIHRSDLLPDRE